MKRVLLLIILIASLFTLTACGSDSSAFAYDAPSDGVLGTKNMDALLQRFLNISDEHPNGNLGERRPFSESEKQMAERLEAMIGELTEGDSSFSVSVIPFAVTSYGSSQNVIVTKRGVGEEPRKTVVIGVNYDDYLATNIMPSYTFGMSSASTQTVSESVGAMENGTGCAAALALIEYVKEMPPYEFDIEFAFFGDGSYGNSGASHYLSEMPQSRKDNILLMYALRRFGGDKLYLYSEEVKTEHEKYLLNLSQENGLNIKSVPKQVPIVNARAVSRLPYAKWAMAGVHSTFMNEHIPVAAIFSGNYETLNLSDIESSKSQPVSYTRADTYTRLTRNFSSYAAQMSAAAKLVASSLSDTAMPQVMASSRANYKNYDWATDKLFVQLAVILLLVAIGIVVVILAQKFEKKYPYVPPTEKKVKIKVAVFGSDYEDKDTDIIIDVKKPDDPFGGEY